VAKDPKDKKNRKEKKAREVPKPKEKKEGKVSPQAAPRDKFPNACAGQAQETSLF